jgi:hypothetical protein
LSFEGEDLCSEKARVIVGLLVIVTAVAAVSTWWLLLLIT